MNRVRAFRAALTGVTLLCLSLAPGASAQNRGDTTTSGTSSAFNPAISLNGLFLGAFNDLDLPHTVHMDEEAHAHEGHGPAPAEEGMNLQEIELRFTADIDPYSKADATLAYHEGEFHFEEAFISSSILPFGLGLRAGQMYVGFSRENVVHTHQLPFVQRSLAQAALFAEGWTEMGLETTWLAPTPWYLQLRGGVFDGDEAAWFGSEDPQDFAYLGGLTSLWDLNESTTFQIDGGLAAGANGIDDATTTRIGSAGVTLRYKPTRSRIYRSLRWSAEYLYADRDAFPVHDDNGELERADRFLSGWTTYAQFQFARRWWTSARYDLFDPSLEAENSKRYGASLSFVPSEFQAIRMEVSYVDRPDEPDAEDYFEFFLQYNFTIGSHPAHRY